MNNTFVGTDRPGSGRRSRGQAFSAGAARSAHRFGYVLCGLPIAVASFSVLVTGFALSAGLLVIVVGIPVAVGTLGAARLFAAAERGHARMVGVELPTPARLPTPTGFHAWWRWLRDPQLWLEFLHGLLVFPVSVATFCLSVSWLAGGLGGTTFWFWSQWLPKRQPGDKNLPELLHWNISESALELILGVIALLLWPAILRVCVAAQVGLARALLGNQRLRHLQDRVETLTLSRAAAVQAEADALRGLERDIHDGPQQRLVRLGMDLSVAERRLNDDPEAVRKLLADARTQTAEALAELRALSRGIAPPILADRGLAAALASVVATNPLPVDLVTEGLKRRPTPVVENAAYFVVTEALANAAKHSAARQVHVRVGRVRDTLSVEVEDDGVGGAHPGKGHGLAGLAARLSAVDGRLEVVSPTGGPTRLRAVIPCA
jgi:signal transduction histidine kinase